LGPQRDKVTGQWRIVHNEELDDLYSPTNIFRVIKSRIMRWAGYIARIRDIRGAYRVLMGKPVGIPEVKRQLKRCRCKWRV
jgi:hypothetical protein